MTGWQKAVKYVAVAIAIWLTITIICGILSSLGVLGFIIDGNNAVTDMKTYEVSQDISALKIEINAADFSVKIGEKFAVVSNLSDLEVEESNGILTVAEKSKYKFYKNYNGACLTLYVPKDHVFNSADIKTGAGLVTVEFLSADAISLNLGAGEVNISKMNANLNCRIEGGAGEFTVSEGYLYNLDLDMGVGQLNLTAEILGNSNLAFGVGESNLFLLGEKEDYHINLDKGIGSAKINGQEISGETVFGVGSNYIDIDCGVGEVNVKFLA